MRALIDAVLTLTALVSPNKAETIASKLRGAGRPNAQAFDGLVGSPAGRHGLKTLLGAWAASGTSADFVAGLLVGAAHARDQALSEGVAELVWTGPTTPYVATRRTDQVLLDLIRGAERELFLVSFVAYDVPEVITALDDAGHRGVSVRMLLESPQTAGGSLTVDSLTAMKVAVPLAKMYAWRQKGLAFADGRVHAKVAVADDRMAFLTSANLTGHALAKNMEAGVVIYGGPLPAALHAHLRALRDTGVIERA